MSNSISPGDAIARSRPRYVYQGWVGASLIAVIVACWGLAVQNSRSARSETTVPHDPPTSRDRQPSPPTTEFVRPQVGGLPRLVVQTGSLEPAESADLHAKISGYLKSVAVDLGSEVEAGQVLAEIDAPELAHDVDSALALLEQAKAQLRQAEARLTAAETRHETARAVVVQAEAEILRAVAERSFREKEFARIRELSERGAIDERLVDEHRRQLDSAQAGEDCARASALVARADLATAAAGIEQARADRIAGEAAVRVASTAVERAQVMLDYTVIRSPYRGVVTQRNFDPGAFVRSAVNGREQPLLTVARTDRMRVAVHVPDRHVPFVNPGDAAEVRIDSLAGETLIGTVARISRRQDPRTRTMRVEIDLPNEYGRLREGMYAAVSISSSGPQRGLTLPAESLIGSTQSGRATVHVVRDGRVQLAHVGVELTADTKLEILWGLEADDIVVLNYDEAHFDTAASESALAVLTGTSTPAASNAFGEH